MVGVPTGPSHRLHTGHCRGMGREAGRGSEGSREREGGKQGEGGREGRKEREERKRLSKRWENGRERCKKKVLPLGQIAYYGAQNVSNSVLL